MPSCLIEIIRILYCFPTWLKPHKAGITSSYRLPNGKQVGSLGTKKQNMQTDLMERNFVG